MFGDNTLAEISCVDTDCEGTVVFDFNDEEKLERVVSECPECGHEYELTRVKPVHNSMNEYFWGLAL